MKCECCGKEIPEDEEQIDEDGTILCHSCLLDEFSPAISKSIG